MSAKGSFPTNLALSMIIILLSSVCHLGHSESSVNRLSYILLVWLIQKMSKQNLKIFLFHGFMAREHMQRHWLHYLAELGYPNVELYGHLPSAKKIAKQIINLNQSKKQKIVLIGYSQGGFQAVKVAQALKRLQYPVDLLVTIAAGGKGRLLPKQWGYNPRQIPENVLKSLNFFSLSDHLGADRCYRDNLIQSSSDHQSIENIIFDRSAQVGHIELSRCYPKQRIHHLVKQHLISRIEKELFSLESSRNFNSVNRIATDRELM
ncbi:alpha/beta hydrolase [Acinetobacter ursingii]